jgi:hypothetical protein
MVSVRIIVGKSGRKILAACSTDLSGKVSDPHIHVIKTLLEFYETRRFIAMFLGARH